MGAQVLPASTWLPLVRRAFPTLAGVGGPGRVALTFDDGPDPASTPALLELLDDLDVRATFFVIGERLERHPDLGRQIVAAGHEIGVHGRRHSYGLTSRAGLRRCVNLVVAQTGCRPVWFRPPYGVLALTSLVEARRCGLRPVLWTVWGRDWTAAATSDSVTAALSPGLVEGATVLLHEAGDTCAPYAWHATLAALPEVVRRCRERGLVVGPLRDHGIDHGIDGGLDGGIGGGIDGGIGCGVACRLDGPPSGGR